MLGVNSASARPCFDGTTRGLSRISGLSRHVAVVILALVCVGYTAYAINVRQILVGRVSLAQLLVGRVLILSFVWGVPIMRNRASMLISAGAIESRQQSVGRVPVPLSEDLAPGLEQQVTQSCRRCWVCRTPIPRQNTKPRHELMLVRYLTNRPINDWHMLIYPQYTTIDGASSTLRQVRSGVPQWSVLGPLLFALYINDIQYAVGAEGVRLFADDTALYMVNSDLQTLLSGTKEKIENLYKWCICNKLTINSEKTHFILFRTVNKPIPNNLT